MVGKKAGGLSREEGRRAGFIHALTIATVCFLLLVDKLVGGTWKFYFWVLVVSALFVWYYREDRPNFWADFLGIKRRRKK